MVTDSYHPWSLIISEIGTARHIDIDGTRFAVRDGGTGEPVVLVHGWPHTSAVWSSVWARLTREYRVIAPDLRGIGGSDRGTESVDATAGARDLLGLLDALSLNRTALVALDAGVPAAFVATANHAGRIAGAVLMESLLMPLPGAEQFLSSGPPWWFGFHSIPGFAEMVVEGSERDYISFFLDAGLAHPDRLPRELRDELVAAYTGRDALRAGFDYYRVGEANASAIRACVAAGPVATPILAVGGNTVAGALARQLGPVVEHLTTAELPDSGHIIPLDQPDELLDLMLPFLGALSWR